MGEGVSYDELVATGKAGGGVSHAQAIPSSSGGGMFLLEGKSIDSAVSMEGIHSPIPSGEHGIFNFINAGGGPLGGTLNQLGEQSVNYLVTDNPKGDDLRFENLVSGDLSQAKAPTFVSETGIRPAGLISGGPASHG